MRVVYLMIRVPVVSSTNKPLMPCHPARARELVRDGRALRRFNKGIFYIKLINREDGYLQPVACGIDPGSKWEGYTVKSAAHTYININADAVTWVKDNVKIRRDMRKKRRARKTPYRQCRRNRSVGSRLAPSTRARWGWKLRISTWLSRVYPITAFVVEDVQVETRKGCKLWNRGFSPLGHGKRWFYRQLCKWGRVEIKSGYNTFEMRNGLGLKKLGTKSSKSFYAHCVDSWVLANSLSGGHEKPDNELVTSMSPIRFHRRQLHVQNPVKGGIRKQWGSTRSGGFSRGSLVKHIKRVLAYIGGYSKIGLSLYDVASGVRLGQKFKIADCTFFGRNSWRISYV